MLTWNPPRADRPDRFIGDDQPFICEIDPFELRIKIVHQRLVACITHLQRFADAVDDTVVEGFEKGELFSNQFL